MANANMIVQLSMNYFRRNNPVDVLVKSISDAVTHVLTFNSKMKLLRYKFSLAQEQLRKMESHVQQGAVHQATRGTKINRAY